MFWSAMFLNLVFMFVDIKLFQSSFTIGRSDIPFLFLILVTCVFLLDQSS